MNKPNLTKDISLQENKYYWTVKELRKFCHILGIPSTGIKADLKMSHLI